MSKELNLHTSNGIIARDPGLGILHAYGFVVPPNNSVGYAPGCRFIKADATSLGTTTYINQGTKAAAAFVPEGYLGALSVNVVYGDGTLIDGVFFVADRPYTVVAVNARVIVAGTDASAVSAQIRRVPNGTAVSGGPAVHTGTINLKGTVDQVQEMTLVTTPASLNLIKGNALGLDVTGTPTAARGAVSVLLLPA